MIEDVDRLAAAEAFLSTYGLTLGDLPRLVRPIGEHECLVLGGSVAEGLGNSDSDLDLLLIGDPAQVPGLVLREEKIEISTIFHGSGLKLSIEVFDPADVDRLASTMHVLIHSMEFPDDLDRLLLIYEEADRKLLHRVRTSIPLAHPDVVLRWRQRLRSDRLPEVVALIRLIDHFTHREDALSHVEQSDLRTASWCLSRCATDMGAALLASVGETNHNSRWVIPLLERHAGDFGSIDSDDIIDLLLTPLSSPAQVDARLEKFDCCLTEIGKRLPTVISVYERLSSKHPVRAHRDHVRPLR